MVTSIPQQPSRSIRNMSSKENDYVATDNLANDLMFATLAGLTSFDELLVRPRLASLPSPPSINTSPLPQSHDPLDAYRLPLCRDMSSEASTPTSEPQISSYLFTFPPPPPSIHSYVGSDEDEDSNKGNTTPTVSIFVGRKDRGPSDHNADDKPAKRLGKDDALHMNTKEKPLQSQDDTAAWARLVGRGKYVNTQRTIHSHPFQLQPPPRSSPSPLTPDWAFNSLPVDTRLGALHRYAPTDGAVYREERGGVSPRTTSQVYSCMGRAIPKTITSMLTHLEAITAADRHWSVAPPSITVVHGRGPPAYMQATSPTERHRFAPPPTRVAEVRGPVQARSSLVLLERMSPSEYLAAKQHQKMWGNAPLSSRQQLTADNVYLLSPHRSDYAEPATYNRPPCQLAQSENVSLLSPRRPVPAETVSFIGSPRQHRGMWNGNAASLSSPRQYVRGNSTVAMLQTGVQPGRNGRGKLFLI